MTKPSIKTDDRPARFARELSRLERGKLAQLRRGLGGDERSVYWLEGLYARTGYLEASPTGKEALKLVAGLYALKPKAQDDGDAAEQSAEIAPEPSRKAVSIGKQMGQLYLRQDRRPSTEKRFLALLDADREGIGHHMRQAVTLLATADLTPDWEKLVTDLLYWNDRTRREWARDFYAEIYREESRQDGKADSKTPGSDASSVAQAATPLFAQPDHQNDERDEGETL